MKMVLSLFPNTRGIGYSFVAVPDNLLEFGMVTTNQRSNIKLLERITKLVNLFQPTIILVRASDIGHPCAPRVMELIDLIVKFAKARNIPIEGYTREQIKDTFEVRGIRTKHEIALQIAKWFPQLVNYVPEARKIYNSEDYYMGIFDSLALLAVYVYLL